MIAVTHTVERFNIDDQTSTASTNNSKRSRWNNIANMVTQVITASAARQVLRTRALQCSFSSVFHLRRAGMNAKDATYIENLFIFSVGVPIVVGLTGGACCYVSNTTIFRRGLC